MYEGINALMQGVQGRFGSAWFQRLRPKRDEPFSNFAFAFNSHHYVKGILQEAVLRSEYWRLVDSNVGLACCLLCPLSACAPPV